MDSNVWTSPRRFPQALDPTQDRVMLVELSEEEFKAAAFLDERGLDPARPRSILGWRDLVSYLAADARQDADCIFHIGHVGSTLISRLLGELPSVFALREPLVLRSFQELALIDGHPESPWSPAMLEERIPQLRALLSRTWRPEQRALIKATSFTSEFGARLLAPKTRALLLYSPPQAYLANILIGEESRQEVHALAPSRLKRLALRLGDLPWRLWELAEPQRAALAWACEMTSLLRIAETRAAEQVRWLDFDRFLDEPASELASLAGFFGHELTTEDAGGLVGGPLMQRYSKGLQYAYSPALRAERLAHSAHENQAQIAEALAWLDAAGARFASIATALEIARGDR
jgi:hypothetical protein